MANVLEKNWQRQASVTATSLLRFHNVSACVEVHPHAVISNMRIDSECIIKPSYMTTLVLRDSPGVHSGGKRRMPTIIVFWDVSLDNLTLWRRGTAPPSHTLLLAAGKRAAKHFLHF